MASELPRISLLKLRDGRAEAYLPLRVLVISPPRLSHRTLGAVWSGGSDEEPPELLDCAIIYAPVGALVPAALKSVRKGGRVVCAGIHMSDIPSFPYSLLWEERQIMSVANLTRHDASEFFGIVPKAGIVTETVPYPLARANEALSDLREGRLQGAAVLVP